MAHFTHYWSNDTWRQEMEQAAGTTIRHLAGNQFSARGVRVGDVVYVVTVLGGVMHVGCRMEVTAILDQAEAERRLSQSLWEADEHLLGRNGTHLRADLSIPSEIAAGLRFGADDAPLAIHADGSVDQQTLRGVRLLTPDSATLLDSLIGVVPNALDASSSAALTKGKTYTRSDLYRLLNVPEELQGGNWATGYHQYKGEWFIFSGVGTAGRTGHDYGNRWIGDDLHWRGKTTSKLSHESIQSMLDGSHAVHVFTRNADRDPYTYHGTATAKETQDTTPVTILWGFGRSETVDRRFEEQASVELRQVQSILNDSALEATEKEQLVLARRGQGRFRRSIRDRQCRVTGITNETYLRASHIKPWRVCDNKERLDGENGLLLAPHIDFLFDAGFITFEDDGRLIISPQADPAVLSVMGIAPEMETVTFFRPQQTLFLRFHRSYVFRSSPTA